MRSSAALRFGPPASNRTSRPALVKIIARRSAAEEGKLRPPLRYLLLAPKDELNRIWVLRKVLNPLSPVESMELIIDKLSKTRSNSEFLASMSNGGR